MNPLRSRLLRATAPWLVGAAFLLNSVRSLAAEASWVIGVTEPVKDVTLAFPIVGIVVVKQDHMAVCARGLIQGLEFLGFRL